MVTRLPKHMRETSIRRACFRVAKNHGLSGVTPARVLAEVKPAMGHTQLWRVAGNTTALLGLAVQVARELGDERIIDEAAELGI
jgi:hypothetical protein